MIGQRAQTRLAEIYRVTVDKMLDRAEIRDAHPCRRDEGQDQAVE